MAFLDEAMTRQITTQAREVHFRRALLTTLAALLFGVGWVAARVWAAVWLAAAWTVVAVRLGWSEARKSDKRT